MLGAAGVCLRSLGMWGKPYGVFDNTLMNFQYIGKR